MHSASFAEQVRVAAGTFAPDRSDTAGRQPFNLKDFRNKLARVVAGLVVLLYLAGCGTRREQAVPTAALQSDEAEITRTPPILSQPGDLFEDATAQAGVQFVHQFCDTRISNIMESNGAGVAVLDYDGDGWMDIYLVNSGPLDRVTHHAPGTQREPNRLYRNKQDGTFEDVTEKTGVAGQGYGIAAVAADYDNDGDTDLYVVNIGKSILYRNRGNGQFEDVSVAAGISHTATGIGAVFVDVDNDGRLDLFVANYLTYDPNYKLYFNPDGYPGPTAYKPEQNILYRNRGDGTFEDISERAGIRIPGHRGMSVCAFDFDQNGTQDLYICNDATANLLLVNDGKGHFEEQGVRRWVAFNALGEAAGSMTAAIGDCTGDQRLDILVSRLGYGSLYVAKAEGIFSDELLSSGLGPITAQYVGWGTDFLDFDNDGDLDGFIANGDAHHLTGWESLLLENEGTGKFNDAVEKGGAYFRTKIRGRGSATLDYDNDGDMDLVVTAIADRAFLLRNRGVEGNHWVTLDLRGTRTNRDGFGASINLTCGGKSQYTQARCRSGFLSQSDRRIHFGLGTGATVDRLEIRWPSGAVQVLQKVPANQILRVQEP